MLPRAKEESVSSNHKIRTHVGLRGLGNHFSVTRKPTQEKNLTEVFTGITVQ